MESDLDDLRAALASVLPDAALEVHVGPLTLVVIRDGDAVLAQWESETGWWAVEVGIA